MIFAITQDAKLKPEGQFWYLGEIEMPGISDF